jgi:serine protease Do
MRMTRSNGVGLFVVGLFVVLIHAVGVSAQSAAQRSSALVDLSGALEAAAQSASRTVVEVFTTSYTMGDGIVPRSADLVWTQRASGSGVIVDPAGYIITNAHVVRGAQRVRVELPPAAQGQSILANRGRVVTAEVVGLDLETDLAVLKVAEQKLPAIAFGDSDELKAGQLVMALGSPLGLHHTVSLGVVSAVARQLEPESPMIYVQTDASINPGSSGGPLVDLRGRLVGINTMIATRAGGDEGLAFAAPSNIVRTVYEQIRKSGRVRRGDIGVTAQTITPTLAAGLGLPRETGVILADVTPRSQAASVGLRPGDLVLTVDGKVMENGRQFQVTLYRRFVGDVVTLEVMRNGETIKFPIAMDERNDAFNLAGTADPRENLVARLGILGVTLNPQIAAMVPIQRVNSGVLVASTVQGAIDARDGGLAAGDVIYAVNRTPVQHLSALRAAIDALKPGDPVVLHLERRGELLYVAFSIE